MVGKKQRLTLIECNVDLGCMMDLAKVADLVSDVYRDGICMFIGCLANTLLTPACITMYTTLNILQQLCII